MSGVQPADPPDGLGESLGFAGPCAALSDEASAAGAAAAPLQQRGAWAVWMGPVETWWESRLSWKMWRKTCHNISVLGNWSTGGQTVTILLWFTTYLTSERRVKTSAAGSSWRLKQYKGHKQQCSGIVPAFPFPGSRMQSLDLCLVYPCQV